MVCLFSNYLFICFCDSFALVGWSAVVGSWLTATSASRVTEERRGKVNPRLRPFFRCLPFAVHMGFWDKGCPRHHDCCLLGLQRRAGGGWKNGERSLEDGHRVLLSSAKEEVTNYMASSSLLECDLS